ncbi:D-3-phosphoglycerate dehydrogenase [hydrothermal vent metagenome]|uniref:D-3-phosphoglycerate dehydrogenase n=1 Tax=hydrothermal vent metagenome TaxID=652676 RepID=A0A3B1D7X1_9ZZZZ
MSNLQVLITDRAWENYDIEQEVLNAIGATIIDSPTGDEETLVKLARNVDAIASCWALTTAAVIKAAPRCKIISRYGIGLDNIDISAATQQGMIVTNVPDYCTEEVADHTIAQLLGLSRNIAIYNAEMKQGIYDRNHAPVMHRLSEQRVGIIGFGAIARSVYRKLLPFGCNIVASTLSQNNHGTDCQMLPLDELIQTSDYVMLLVPLTKSTHHLINSETLSQMKEGAFLINTSRGGLVDYDAVWDALQKNKLTGAAFDVFTPEPPDLSHPLFKDNRVIISPHAAFLTVESTNDLRKRSMQHIVDFFQGRRPPHIVNPEVLERSDAIALS